MLQYLKVENLALIDRAVLEAGPGFTAVTGETGAGKSVLMGALSLLAGARADRSAIRDGAEACEVQAHLWFAHPERLDEVLAAAGLPATEEGNLVLRRRIQAAGGQRIQVNGEVATLGQLAALGGVWLELHGSDAPRALFQRAAQVDLLDAFAGNGEELAAYRKAFHHWQDLRRQREKLEGESILGEDERAFLQGQIDEIRALPLSADWLADLEQRYQRIRHVREIADYLRVLEENLSGPASATERLTEVYRVAGKLREITPGETGPLVDRLDSLLIELNDLVGEFEGLRRLLEADPAEIEETETQMQGWLSLRRKHGSSVEAVLEKAAAMEERIASQGNREVRLAELGKAEAEAEVAVRAAGETLGETRRAAAGELAGRVEELLARLGFRKARFAIEVEPVEPWNDRGTTSCEYRFSGTAGQVPLPLAKVASSGEIARVTLAVKTVLAEVDRTAVLVFDEIDANVGGEIGREIGRELSRLAEGNQVFAITHLPQVASLARAHYVVEKESTDDEARVRLRPLAAGGGERVEEITRMLGDRSSTAARQHAEELLREAPAAAGSGS